jgi:type II secretory pathway pseudopilin PulG
MMSHERVSPDRDPRRDSGFTVIEVAVAAILLSLGALAVLSLVGASNRNNYRAEQSQVVNDRLQQQMEAIKQLPYKQIVLTTAPANSLDSTTPSSRLAGATFNVNQSGTANYENLAYNGSTNPGNGKTLAGGSVAPGPIPFKSGNVSGDLYRYVTWEADPACGNATQSDCGERYYKRITIDVTLKSTAPGGTRAYQEIQGYVSNPNAGLPASQGGEGNPDEGGPGPGPGNPGSPTPWTFWLTDTPCSPEPPSEARQPITASHDSHNTLGACQAGVRTGGTTPGAPDLMFTDTPPCSNGGCDNPQPLYDYATDVEPDVQPDQDRGLQMLAPPDPGHLGCTVNIASATNLSLLGSTPLQATPWLYVHKWLSPPIPSNSSDVVLDGNGTLDLWTQSINGTVYPGAVCVWLFVRQTVGANSVDTFVVNQDLSGNPAYFRYSRQTWPTTAWSEVSIPLHFAAVNAQGALQQLHIPANARLGIAIGVEGQGTYPNTGLQFMYDAPTFDSRLEVDTHSIVPSF